MSKSWSFFCLQCDAEPEDFDGFNHGQDILRSIYRLREHAFAIQDQDRTQYLSVEILGCHAGEELWLFLRKHEGHEIALRSEYGDIEPIEGEREITQGQAESNPYLGIAYWGQAWDLLHQMGLTHTMSSVAGDIYVHEDVYLGRVEQVANMSQEDVRQKMILPICKISISGHMLSEP